MDIEPLGWKRRIENIGVVKLRQSVITVVGLIRNQLLFNGVGGSNPSSAAKIEMEGWLSGR